MADESYMPRRASSNLPGRPESANLADILERVLDKGIVIAGDIQINLLDIELLTIKLRLLIASVERAQEMGINWWESDPALQSNRERPELESGADLERLEEENRELRERLDRLENRLEAGDDQEKRPRDASKEPWMMSWLAGRRPGRPTCFGGPKRRRLHTSPGRSSRQHLPRPDPRCDPDPGKRSGRSRHPPRRRLSSPLSRTGVKVSGRTAWPPPTPGSPSAVPVSSRITGSSASSTVAWRPS